MDVGLNVLAATSDGALYGEAVKPQFDKLYARIKVVRANRQRQGLRENSPRLDSMESSLTGFVKTETGKIASLLVVRNPGTLFVVEDLDLSGCKGQKRFAYRALQTSLERKAHIEKVNPAYTSQECPSCVYARKANRSGIRFKCLCCGKKAHADWVGASGILRRSEDNGITCDDRPFEVKRILSVRFLLKRTSSLGSGKTSRLPDALTPMSQRLTVGVLGLSRVPHSFESGSARL